LDKDNFIGKSALEKRSTEEPKQKLVSLNIKCTHAPAHSGASLMDGNKVIGTITSGDWGHRINMNLAYAFVDPNKSKIGAKFKLDLLGELVPAEVIAAGPYDPSHKRLQI
jgi:dimethylglycine dehydrogenase